MTTDKKSSSAPSNDPNVQRSTGMRFLVTSLAFLVLALVIDLVLQLELATASSSMLSSEMFRSLDGLRTSTLVFLVALPAIFGGLGNLVLPRMVGASAVMWPGLNALAYLAYLGGGALLVAGSLGGGMAVVGVPVAVLGASLAGFSAFCLAVNFLVTLHFRRAPGVGLSRMPIVGWSIYGASLLSIMLAPLLGLVAFGAVICTLWDGSNAALWGIGPVLERHVAWFQSDAALYVLAVPAFGVVAEVFAVHSRRRLAGYSAIAFCCLLISMLGSLAWLQFQLATGDSAQAVAGRGFLTLMVSVPSLVILGACVATLHRGSIRLRPPFWFALASLVMFTFGVLAGTFPATMAAGVHLGGTAFTDAFRNYMLVGGGVLALLAGVYHWWPAITGQAVDETPGRLSCLLAFVGYDLAFFAQAIAGSQGLPSGVNNFAAASEGALGVLSTWSQVAMIGTLIGSLGILLALAPIVQAILRNAKGFANPWDAQSLEWKPNASATDVARGPYEFAEIEAVDHH